MRIANHADRNGSSAEMRERKARVRRLFRRIAIGIYTVGFMAAAAFVGEHVSAQITLVSTASKDFRQAANDDSGTCGVLPGHACALGHPRWINSIVQQSNSDYFEGMSVPQRMMFLSIPQADMDPSTAGDQHTLTFSHQATKGGIHTYDFLTSWNQAQTAGDVYDPDMTPPGLLFDLFNDECGEVIGPSATSATCQSLSGGAHCVTAAIPGGTGNPAGTLGSTLGQNIDNRIDAYQGVFGSRTIRICGNLAMSGATLAFTGYTGTDLDANYKLTWTSLSDEVLVEVAGHLSVGTDNGDGAGCTAANTGSLCMGYGTGKGSASISGGPYHFKADELDDASLGSLDNQIKGAGILFCTPGRCDDDKSCTDDVCDEGTDTCGHVAVNSRCDDGESCTNDLCDATNGPSPTGCVYTPVAVSTPCEADGNLCTNDQCDGAGHCVFVNDKGANCPGPSGPCDGGSSCNPATGACEANPDPTLSTFCNVDNNLCTLDHCDGFGNCVNYGNVNATCAPAVPPCEGGETCNPATGVCDPNPDAQFSTFCERGDADGLCTVDHCDGFGNCILEFTVQCQAAVPPCESGQFCEPTTGACVDNPDAAFSTSCERNDPLGLCTVDHCDGGGNCVFLSNVVCPGSTGQCDPGETCVPATGLCVMNSGFPPFSTPCEEDGDLCTIEHCDGAGSCVFKEDVVCPPPTGSCDSGTNCDPTTGACSIDKPDPPLSTFCERDGDKCTNDHCDGFGNCVPLSTVTCPPPTGPCDGGTNCDPTTGLCTIQKTDAPQSTPCEADAPPDLCKVDHCDGSGDCVFFFQRSCSPPLGPCDGGENCNLMNGLCEPKPDPLLSTFCERGDPAGLCTNDHCDGMGNCVLDFVKDCPDPVPPCEAGADCDPLNGTCVPNPDPQLSTPCEADGEACTKDHCDGNGLCVFFFCQTPGITCPLDLIFECDAVGAFGDPTVDDDCSVTPMVVCTEESTPGKLPQERTIIRTCTVTNDCGNSAQCVQRIDIVDTAPPTVTCPPDCTLECGEVLCVPPNCDDASCECGGVATCEDNCSTCTVSVTCEVIPKNCTSGAVAGVTPPPKLTIIRTYSATDATAAVTATGQGNIGTCVQQIELVDTTPPALDAVFCPGTITVCAGAELSFTPPTCTDTCGTCDVICVRSDNQPLPGPPPNGPITVTCVSSDECGNESSCVINVEVSESGDCFVVVPTVSEWGLVVLTLLLLTGAKVYFGRRQVDAA